MSDTTTSLETQFSSPSAPDTPLAVVLESLVTLVESPEPAVVFSSLVRLCVPSICASASASILGSDQNVYAVSWPRMAHEHADSRHGLVTTEFEAPETSDHPGYHGVFSLRFDSPDHSHAFLARLLVERALATVERGRLTEVATRRERVAANLELALVSNRQISVAVGIVMARRSLTSEQAFEVLRTVSQSSNRKLRDIALEVAHGGDVALTDGAATGGRRVYS